MLVNTCEKDKSVYSLHHIVVSKTTLACTVAYPTYNANTFFHTGQSPVSNKTSYCNINVGNEISKGLLLGMWLVYRICSNIGATKNELQFAEAPPIKTENFASRSEGA